MAKPQALQFLSKGKLLTGANFPNFVDTWNWMVRVVSGLCGDADRNKSQGCVTVDRTDPDNPVIRIERQNLSGSGGGGGGEGTAYVGPLQPTFAEDGTLSGVTNPWWAFGRQYHFTVAMPIDAGAHVSEGMICLEITHPTSSSSVASPKIIEAGSWTGANTDPGKTVIPLYHISDGAIDCDMRPMMNLAVRE